MNKVLFSSNKTDWETPKSLFDQYNRAFKFDIDVCASEENAKCDAYFTEEDNALEKEWIGNCWCNPPYGKEIGEWLKKAYHESLKGALVVCLIPARTDTKYWHEYVQKAYKIEYLKGRLKFGGAETGAPFPSAIVIFWNGYERTT